MTNKLLLIHDDNIRIDRYIRQNVLKDIPQSLLQRCFRKKLITVDNKKIKPDAKVQKGQTLSISSAISFIAPKKHSQQKTQKDYKNYEILYQDEFILAINKPIGLAVQGGHKIYISIHDTLCQFDKINNEVPRIIHRLDKDTSGVLLLARTLTTARFLAQSFADRTIKKTYRAYVTGQLPTTSGTIDIPLSNQFKHGQELVCADNQNGKSAITHFKLLQPFPEKNISYVELHPTTGRKHQLRAHMQYLGNPIYGDKKYGEVNATSTLALHAHSIELKLPNETTVSITAPLPHHMSLEAMTSQDLQCKQPSY